MPGTGDMPLVVGDAVPGGVAGGVRGGGNKLRKSERCNAAHQLFRDGLCHGVVVNGVVSGTVRHLLVVGEHCLRLEQPLLVPVPGPPGARADGEKIGSTGIPNTCCTCIAGHSRANIACAGLNKVADTLLAACIDDVLGPLHVDAEAQIPPAMRREMGIGGHASARCKPIAPPRAVPRAPH